MISAPGEPPGSRVTMTRSFVAGGPDADQQHLYDVVLQAQTAGVAAVRAGLSTRELDAVCRDTIGAAATKELLFTGEALGAAEARALGLVNRVIASADLDRAVADLCAQIARNAPLSVRAMKAFVQRASDERRAYRRDDLEEMARVVRASADAREGLAAQRERRPPAFRGA